MQAQDIRPELASGFRDYLPEDMIPRQKMFDTIRRSFERFGFVPLDTPGMEREEVLTGGDPNFRMQIFKAKLRGEDDGMALRFDLTVPLARVISLYGGRIQRPFKRYHMGKVWRGEKAQAGRFREFVQFDADIVGSGRMSSDAEIISLMHETMKMLGLERFIIRVNNRKILNGLADIAGFNRELTPDVLRTIDKFDKIGWQGVSTELAEKSLNGEQISKLEEFIRLSTEDFETGMASLASLMEGSPEAMSGIRELREIAENLQAMGMPSDKWRVDLSVARGLGYYTGPVFETILTDLPEIGSVFSGGRYDDLVARFSNESLPAVGASVGVDRLFAAMEQLNLVKKENSVAQVVVLNFDQGAELYCQKVTAMLRRADIQTELYLGKETNLKAQLAWALRKNPRVIIIAGESERAKGTVQVKNVQSRVQTAVSLQDLPVFVGGVLT